MWSTRNSKSQLAKSRKPHSTSLFVCPDLTLTFMLNMQRQSILEKDKAFFTSALIAAISQKSNNVYQDFKITKMEPVTVDNGNYMLVDFKYTLLTGAGFEVERKGVSSVTSAGGGVQLLWCASIAARYKNKTEGQLRTIAQSFRCYADGLNFSADLRSAAPDFV